MAARESGERFSSTSGSGQNPAAKRVLVHFGAKIHVSSNNNINELSLEFMLENKPITNYRYRGWTIPSTRQTI